MEHQPKPGFMERLAEKLKWIPNLHQEEEPFLTPLTEPGHLTNYPPPEQWNDWVEYEAKSWPKRKPHHYMIVPTSCFNCEAGCGLLSYVDKETLEVRKFEGNPYHPGSRGKNCAKGPATINQIKDVDRILYPLKRMGKRGEGQWKQVSWEEALDDIAGNIRKAFEENRRNEVVYHVGRPGHEGYMERVLKAWGIDGHNSHTNICSSGARLGYAIWHGFDRPSPDHANARFILLLSAHLEAGHYFNPHAQRIMEGLQNGAQLAVMDPRLSNTASLADYWLPTHPGSEAAVLLAMAFVLLERELYQKDFLYQWVNWEAYLQTQYPQTATTFENFIAKLKEEYQSFTLEFAEKESHVPAKQILEVALKIGQAGTRFAAHNWRGAGSGNLGGWQVARCLHFLSVLTGSVGTLGGTSPSGWNKFKPTLFDTPPAQKFWNELHFPKEYPLSHYEMSFLLPHFLKENRSRLAVYFTRVFNPVWTYPDGFSWIEVLRDEEKIGLHVALTPTWNETAYFADYVLPMGHASERHDILSYETHSGMWLSFRQPVLREVAKRMGKPVTFTYEVNPGQVWEEDEFWIELSWKIDPQGSLGIQKHFCSPYRPGEKITIEEYYRALFDKVPGLPEKAKTVGLDPLGYMQKYGAFELEKVSYQKHLVPLTPEQLQGSTTDPNTHVICKNNAELGVMIGDTAYVGFPTPSRKQEFFSQTLVDWGWPEYKIPTYIKSHIHPEKLAKNEFPLLPTFRLPTLIHSRSGNAKWLAEISHRNPLWMHSKDAIQLEIQTADLVRVTTDIGYFVTRIWATESIKPGVVACSHHLGRWRRPQDSPGNRWATNLVELKEMQPGAWKMQVIQGIEPFESQDPDSSRIFWSDGGVHQNITFPVHPDPLSGMHCWHQKVRIEKAHPEDSYGEVFVDTNKSFAIYQEWLKMTRPAPGPHGLRRPLWLNRPLRPTEDTFYIKES
ncbi:MAG: molybdopterin-dependent oxidoreductase [Planctomycetota bacterium]